LNCVKNGEKVAVCCKKEMHKEEEEIGEGGGGSKLCRSLCQ
jgi:hypothetical protein